MSASKFGVSEQARHGEFPNAVENSFNAKESGECLKVVLNNLFYAFFKSMVKLFDDEKKPAYLTLRQHLSKPMLALIRAGELVQDGARVKLPPHNDLVEAFRPGLEAVMGLEDGDNPELVAETFNRFDAWRDVGMVDIVRVVSAAQLNTIMNSLSNINSTYSMTEVTDNPIMSTITQKVTDMIMTNKKKGAKSTLNGLVQGVSSAENFAEIFDMVKQGEGLEFLEKFSKDALRFPLTMSNGMTALVSQEEYDEISKQSRLHRERADQRGDGDSGDLTEAALKAIPRDLVCMKAEFYSDFHALYDGKSPDMLAEGPAVADYFDREQTKQCIEDAIDNLSAMMSFGKGFNSVGSKSGGLNLDLAKEIDSEALTERMMELVKQNVDK